MAAGSDFDAAAGVVVVSASPAGVPALGGPRLRILKQPEPVFFKDTGGRGVKLSTTVAAPDGLAIILPLRLSLLLENGQPVPDQASVLDLPYPSGEVPALGPGKGQIDIEYRILKARLSRRCANSHGAVACLFSGPAFPAGNRRAPWIRVRMRCQELAARAADTHLLTRALVQVSRHYDNSRFRLHVEPDIARVEPAHRAAALGIGAVTTRGTLVKSKRRRSTLSPVGSARGSSGEVDGSESEDEGEEPPAARQAKSRASFAAEGEAPNLVPLAASAATSRSFSGGAATGPGPHAGAEGFNEAYLARLISHCVDQVSAHHVRQVQATLDELRGTQAAILREIHDLHAMLRASLPMMAPHMRGGHAYGTGLPTPSPTPHPSVTPHSSWHVSHMGGVPMGTPTVGTGGSTQVSFASFSQQQSRPGQLTRGSQAEHAEGESPSSVVTAGSGDQAATYLRSHSGASQATTSRIANLGHDGGRPVPIYDSHLPVQSMSIQGPRVYAAVSHGLAPGSIGTTPRTDSSGQLLSPLSLSAGSSASLPGVSMHSTSGAVRSRSSPHEEGSPSMSITPSGVAQSAAGPSSWVPPHSS